MDGIKKLLRHLTQRERRSTEEAVKKILGRELSGLDVKKLKGPGSAYRVRLGSIRIIFTEDHEGIRRIVTIERRGESTYRNL